MAEEYVNKQEAKEALCGACVWSEKCQRYKKGSAPACERHSAIDALLTVDAVPWEWLIQYAEARRPKLVDAVHEMPVPSEAMMDAAERASREYRALAGFIREAREAYNGDLC